MRRKSCRLSFLLMASIALVMVSCAYEPRSSIYPSVRLFPGDDVAYRRFDQAMTNPDARNLNLPGILSMPYDGGIFWLSITSNSLPSDRDTWLALLQPSTASELWVHGVRLDADGQFPPQPFINSSKTVLYRIPVGLFSDGEIPDIRLRMYSDGGETRIPAIIFLTDPKEVHTYELINFMSNDLYNYLACLSGFMFVFFLVQFFQRPTALPNLFFAFFNLFISGYYLGLGNTFWGLPFTYSVGLTRGLLFMAISAGVMFFLSFTKNPSRLLIFGAGILGLVLFGNLTFLSHHLSRARSLFNIALIPSMSVLIASLVHLFRLYHRGMKELIPVLIGGFVAISAGIFDTIYAIQGLKPLFWLQGIGIFILLLSVFLTIIERTNRLHSELEGYARGVEDEVNRRTRELHDTNIALSKANTAKSEFLAHMSHEIRTPLNCIMGFTQMLEQHSVDKNDRHNLRMILEEAEHLMQLINHILDFSRIEQGNVVLEKSTFNLLESVIRVLEGFSVSARAKGLQIELLAGNDLPHEVHGDMIRFQQVLINILGNAIKFTERGFVRLELHGETANAPHEYRVQIKIIDSGIGIPEERVGSIFNSFEQADTSITRRYGGSGLGLTIASELIKMMDGEIEVQSSVGVGTTITYVLHFDAALSPAPKLPASKAAKNKRHDFGYAYTVMVVEDYHTNLEVIKLFLDNAKLKVLEAMSGAGALDMVQKHAHEINLILMDLHMPDMDGFETTRRIRQTAAGISIPIVALTADAYEQTRSLCVEAGMQDVLTKPIRYPDLMSCLEKQLQQDATQGSSEKPTMSVSESDTNNHTRQRLDPVDLKTLQEVFFDDQEVISHLIDGFVSSGETLLKELLEGMNTMNLAVIHLKAHALKGGALNISAPYLIQAAENLEKAAKKREIVGLKEQHALVISEWDIMVKWWKAQTSNST